jgi:hypothetical protein
MFAVNGIQGWVIVTEISKVHIPASRTVRIYVPAEIELNVPEVWKTPELRLY